MDRQKIYDEIDSQEDMSDAEKREAFQSACNEDEEREDWEWTHGW